MVRDSVFLASDNIAYLIPNRHYPNPTKFGKRGSLTPLITVLPHYDDTPRASLRAFKQLSQLRFGIWLSHDRFIVSVSRVGQLPLSFPAPSSGFLYPHLSPANLQFFSVLRDAH